MVETIDVRFDETNGSQREHLPPVLDEQSPEETIKFKAIEDVIPTKESAEEFIPVHEERRADAPEEQDEENGAEENADQKSSATTNSSTCCKRSASGEDHR